MLPGESSIANNELNASPAPVMMNVVSQTEATLPIRNRMSKLLGTPFAEDNQNLRQDNSDSHGSSNSKSDGTVNTSSSPGGRRYLRDITTERSASSSPFRLQMPFLTPGQLAFSALQFLPVPILILNNLKTVVLANEAVGKLLGTIPEANDSISGDETLHALERLKGQSLSQVGIDMVQKGRPVWIAWEAFLDSLVDEMGSAHPQASNRKQQDSQYSRGQSDATPTSERFADKKLSGEGQQAVVEVVVSRGDLNKSNFDSRLGNKTSENQTYAKMIISVWEIEGQTYFTLTFTSTKSMSPAGSKKKAVARLSSLEAAERKTIYNTSNPPSVVSSLGSSSSPSYRISPSSVSMSSSPFPPMGPPSHKPLQSSPSVLQKIIIIKDALIDNTEMPIFAMWKDGSIAYPNAAARALMAQDPNLDRPTEGLEALSNWVVYTEDFSRTLEPEEYPIAILLKTQAPFSGLRCGIIKPNGTKVVYDALGELICDDETHEFLAGVVTCRDVTKIAKEIDRIKERDAERFKLMCDMMPQLVWTTMPDGKADFFNSRWYEFTGASPQQSLGDQWANSFHPDDIGESVKRWSRSVRTGEPYVTEYRCRHKSGEYRWMLGRAMPLRNPDTGKIEKWFGTCTDVHEGIETKLAARRTRQQLLSVIAHAHVTIFTVDLHRKITMLEGALTEHSVAKGQDPGSKWYIGGNVDEVFNRLNPQLPEGERPDFLSAIDAIFARRAVDAVVEHNIDGRHFRTRFLPMAAKRRRSNDSVETELEEVIGMIMDVTELKAKEAVLEAQAKEKQQLLANEAAAKEANRLKSQFLANMSHEIRTPITGVIGMAELLLDVDLEEEPREYAENIFRSANSLLTVINDILDFSKVESGRLDIEEVQFSMSVIVRDVAKMLSFAAERRNLEFVSDIPPDVAEDLVVIGDPGRVRQIITNLLTNSIKFTHQGFVKLSVAKESETDDTIELRFTVQDTGIGMDEDARSRLFQPFSQGDASTARKFGGTGLGLTICKSLLELMRGRIVLDSVANQGTTATFWVPFNKPQDPQPSNAVRILPLPDRLQSEMSMSCNGSEFDQLVGTTPPGDILGTSTDKGKSLRFRASFTSSTLQDDLARSERGKIHVLVVEDNAINQQIATKTIKKLGFNVSAAWNGKEALDYLDSAREGTNRKPDIILMDVQMPIIDGYKTTHLLRHHLPYKAFVRDVPIVAMTASAIQGDQEKCRKAGMDDYLAKPVKSRMLEKMLIRWSINKRAGPTPQPSSNASDCSDASNHCKNPGIPCVTVEDGADTAGQSGDAMLEEPGLEDSRNSVLTPRPKTSPPPTWLSPTESQTPIVPSSSPKPDLKFRRVETGELAQHSRDDKLIDAGGGPPSAVTPLAHTPLIEKGDSLTEANVQKFQREEFRRRMT